ncbi:MAG: hypothetical protein ACREIS_00795 [Nitrospiraceae bacterium]
MTIEKVPRCGTCLRPAAVTPENEGYSHCCNDRIEDPREYMKLVRDGEVKVVNGRLEWVQ